jgi:hypothetical protein
MEFPCRSLYEELLSYSFYKENDIKYHPTGKFILRICKKCGWMDTIKI